MNTYYVYQYLREDNTPYYVGKGSGKRAWCKDRTIPRPLDPSYIHIVKNNLTEKEAFDLERQLILSYGRKNNGTGILRNLTDGGEGSTGVVNKVAWNKGKQMSKEYGKTRSDALKKYKRTKTHQENLTKSLKGRNPTWIGKSHSLESKKKISDKLTGMRQPRLTCPHCNKVGGQANMKRYHFNQCKALVNHDQAGVF